VDLPIGSKTRVASNDRPAHDSDLLYVTVTELAGTRGQLALKIIK